MEVVGVVADVRTGSLDKEPPLMVYEPYWNIGPGGPSFVLRTAREPALVSAQLRAVIAALDPELPLLPSRTMQQILGESVAARRFQTSLAAAFAISALLLASLGIYGVVSFSVARRIPELGIRLALGPQAGQIPVAGGLAAGAGGALAAGRLIASQLYGVTPRDPWTIAEVATLLAVAGAVACWIPARRAARVNSLDFAASNRHDPPGENR